MDKITIGAIRVLGNYRVIIRQDETAVLDVDNDNNSFKVELKFNNDTSGYNRREAAFATWTTSPEIIRISFWTMHISPVVITGKSALGLFEDGTEISFYAEVYRSGQFGVISIQLMKKENK